MPDPRKGRTADLRCGHEAVLGSMQKRTSMHDTLPELDRSTLSAGGDIRCALEEYPVRDQAVCSYPKSKADNLYRSDLSPADRVG